MNKTISLCMIVKNEEKHLQKCLESVNEKVDEIIIVDTGSSDSTIEIAQKYTQHVYHYEWADDFAAARNFSLKHATSDYILVLDADEYLDPASDLKKDIVSNHDCYLLKIRNTLSHGGAFTHRATRLFRNNNELTYQNRLHEHLNIMDGINKYSNDTASSLIHHIGYTDEIMSEKDKVNRNLPLMLKEVMENPNAYNLYNMGKTYMADDQYENAILYFKKAYPLSTNRMFLPELITKLSYCLGKIGKHENGLEILADAVGLFSSDVEMQYMQGKLFLEAGYIKDAELAFHRCLELGDQGAFVTEGSGGYMARFMLAQIYESQNQISKSYNEIIEVLQMKKKFTPGLRKYFEIVMKANIPIENVEENISFLYSVESIEDLQLLMDVLYSARCSLLNTYLEKYKIQAQPHIKAIGLQYAKRYEEAKSLWGNIDGCPEECNLDILLLSIITRDTSLFERASYLLNYSKKETKILRDLFENKETEKASVTKKFEQNLLMISKKLILLEEFKPFEDIARIILKLSLEVRCELNDMLYEYGFSDLAEELAMKIIDESPTNKKAIGLIGDILLSKGFLADAERFYIRHSKLIPNYKTLVKVYELYQSVGDYEKVEIMKKEIKHKYPWSLVFR